MMLKKIIFYTVAQSACMGHNSMKIWEYCVVEASDRGQYCMDMSCRSIIHGALLYENVGILSCIYMHVHFEYEATLCDDAEILPCTYIIYGMVKIWTLPCTQFQYLFLMVAREAEEDINRHF